MKQNFLFNILLLSLFFWIGSLKTEGFTAETLVYTQCGAIPIEQLIIGDYVITDDAVLHTYPITYIAHLQVDTYIKIKIDKNYVYTSLNQKFYLPNKQQWVSAHTLAPFDELLCINGDAVCIDEINVIHEPQKMYALSVATSHKFCISPYRIITHNIEPVTTGTIAAMTIVLSAACPPAGAAIAIGKVVTCIVAGLGIYHLYKKTKKNKNQLKFFSEPSYIADQKNSNRCFSPDNNPTPQITPCFPTTDIAKKSDSGCTIMVENTTKNSLPIPYEKPEVTIISCSLPKAEATPSILCFEDTQKDTTIEAQRYSGPKYNRTEDWIKEHPFGQKIKKSLERSCFVNQGKRAFELIKKLDNCDGFKKGDYVVIDALHNDHLEVFDRHGEWKRVANFDGTINEKKTEQGAKVPRERLKEG